VSLDVEVRRGENALRARARNLSIGGAFVEIADKPGLDERVQVRFTIGGHAIQIAGIVRWHAVDGVGMQFDGLRACDVYELGKFFETLPHGSEVTT